MIYKKLFVFIIILIFISQVSSVNAIDDNETCIGNENSDFLSIDSYDYDDYDVNQFECYKGDDISIHIVSPTKGNLKVLVDDKECDSFNFTNDETILFSTYDFKSFNDDSKVDICVGSHDFSLIFNFESSDYYDVSPVIEKDFEGKVIIHCSINTCGNLLNDNCRYDSTLNIINRDFNTINIHNLDKFDLYDVNNDYPFTILVYGINLFNTEFYEYDSIGMIVSNKSGVIYKNSIGRNEFQDFPECSINELISLCHFNELGIYNLTVVNFMDGVQDSVLFEIVKYSPEFKIDYLINGSTVKFFLDMPYDYKNKAIISIDDVIFKEITDYDSFYYEVTFENLTQGNHVMKMHCSENKFSEQFNYNLTFEITNANSTDIDSSNINDNFKSNVVDNRSDVSVNIFAIQRGIGDSNLINFLKIQNSIKNSDLNILKNIPFNNSYISNLTVGLREFNSDYNEFSHGNNAHEILKKSVNKSIDNSSNKLILIIIILIALIMGYFKFKIW